MTTMMRLMLLLLQLYAAYAANMDIMKSVSLMGRVQITPSGTYKADWEGSGFRLNAKAISTSKPCFLYWLHRELQLSIPVTADHQSLEIHMLKVTEISCADAEGMMEIQSVTASNLQLLSLTDSSICYPSNGKLLFIGDSLTAAYGVDGADPCDFTADTEDVTHGYSFLVGAAVSAEVHSIAWSGKGVVHNNGDSVAVSVSPMPVYYNRTFGSLENTLDNYWQPVNYLPNVISIMLGQNDYSTQPSPTDDQFISALIAFINQIKADYPLAEVLLICSPAPVVPQQCPNIFNASSVTHVHYYEIPSVVYEGGTGCNGHPNQVTQQNMAKAVTPVISELMTMNMRKNMQSKRSESRV